MAVNTFNVTDVLAVAQAQTPYHLQDAPIFNKYLALMLSGAEDALLTLKDLMQNRSIDTATGAQLDIIGDIVGQSRILTDISTIKHFGFDGTTSTGTFSTTQNTAIGGYWYSISKSQGGSITLEDTQYRLFIKAKIARNTTHVYIDDVATMIAGIFGLKVYIISNDAGTCTLRTSRKLSLFERACLTRVEPNGANFIPRPLGCKLVIEEPTSSGTLGFLGTIGAAGMVSLYAVNPVGGVFGSALEDY